ncbi:hypothetical protein ACIGDM_10280 [Rothia koreensis]|uniref:hypothetical protein n=1 Tax=Rothia koreensis TaxID=592378 RepID=UPI0037C96243
MELSAEQKDAKIAYLSQENNRLREALLDQQILTGAIRLDTNNETETETEPEDEAELTYGTV